MDLHRLPAELRTRRLVVRLARDEDGPAVADALEESLALLVPWFKWAEYLERWGERGDFEDRARTGVRRLEEGEGPTYFLWDDARVVGEVWFGAEGARFGSLEYNVWVRRSAAGTGFGAEGSRAALAAVFAAGVEVVEARVRSENAASRRLLTAVGFRRHGWLHGVERYVVEPATLVTEARGSARVG